MLTLASLLIFKNDVAAARVQRELTETVVLLALLRVLPDPPQRRLEVHYRPEVGVISTKRGFPWRVVPSKKREPPPFLSAGRPVPGRIPSRHEDTGPCPESLPMRGHSCVPAAACFWLQFYAQPICHRTDTDKTYVEQQTTNKTGTHERTTGVGRDRDLRTLGPS